ncbi:MAG: aminoacetone oxidase family FAD-binding enzyme [Bacillota bacterium]|nr:aminoacetone oxidase family FAD-binding enzyme [Bacillota bacterium]
MIYDTIIIGAGAAGLFYGANDTEKENNLKDSNHSRNKLILEKTGKPGLKLLMSGKGMCNITHGGSIKDFLQHYGEKGNKVRSCLYRNNNQKLMSFLEDGGIPLLEREDGKIFPRSLNSRDILDLLLNRTRANGYDLRANSEVTDMEIVEESSVSVGGDSVSDETSSSKILVTLRDKTILATKRLIIATGGASYPSTGSDGSFMKIIERSLKIDITPLRPALSPIYVQNYNYGNLSGISFEQATVRSGKHQTQGPLLLTHKGFSGPAILHLSQYVKAGDELIINFMGTMDFNSLLSLLKRKQHGNNRGISNFLSQEFALPKAFADSLATKPASKFSSAKPQELEAIARNLTEASFSVSGVGGFKEAMVTAGGVALHEVDLKTMRLFKYPQINVIGEALDINGDTGGYNLQFAYSSAMAALSI